MTDREQTRCLCGAEITRANSRVRWRHVARSLDKDHRASPPTGTYLDSPGMRAAHLRSMGR